MDDPVVGSVERVICCCFGSSPLTLCSPLASA